MLPETILEGVSF